MKSGCGSCRHGNDRKPDGAVTSGGTVWCGLRKLQMARNRKMPCLAPLADAKVKRCIDCSKSKMLKPSGETPALGNVWCEKKRVEMNKLRGMECFE